MRDFIQTGTKSRQSETGRKNDDTRKLRQISKKAQISFKIITLSKEKLVSSYTRPQELSQQIFYRIFRTLLSTRKIFTTKTLYLIFVHS